MSKHNLTGADQVYVGSGYDGPVFGANGARGVPVAMLTKLSLGSPIAADANALIAAATSTELPNNSTKTYTTANAGSSPCDDAGIPAAVTIQTADGRSVSVWPIATARNISVNVTHGTSIVACSVTVSGYDVWGYKTVETLSVTATGTNKTVAGLKAFRYVESVAIASAGDATTNTVNVGWGDALGLPYKLTDAADLVRVSFNGALDTGPTVAAAVTTSPATATTGDVRGTVDTTSACNGSPVVVWMHVQDPGSPEGLRGVAQYGG